jgi:hypothetical protein
MLAVKGRYNGATVVLDSIPNFEELGSPIKECEVIVNFPDISKAEHKQENSLKQILKYRGQDIWEGDVEEMRSPR